MHKSKNCLAIVLNAVLPAEIHLKLQPILGHPWQRIHVHHAQFGRYLLLVTIDAYFKWPEVQIVLQAMIDKLKMIFAIPDLPMTLVSDNGSPFQSAELCKFMTANGIVHRHLPPYHPSSNGLAEYMVKTVKQALSKCKITKDATIETHIAPHTTILVTAPLQECQQNYFSIKQLELTYHQFTLAHLNEWKKSISAIISQDVFLSKVK